MFIKVETKRESITPEQTINESIDATQSNDNLIIQSNKSSIDIFENMSSQKKKIIGLSLAAFAGICYGQSNTPILYIAGRSGF